ncbi:MAG: DMT family transporter [Bacteroidia bacterium]
MNKQVKSPLVHLALFSVSAIYAANYSIAQWAMPEYLGPFGFILIRVFFGAIVFYSLYRFLLYEPIKERKHYLQLAVAGFFGVSLNMLAFFKGLSMTSVINASVLMLFAPVFVVIISAIKFKNRISIKVWLGILISFIGAAFLVGVQRFSLGSNGIVGDLLVVLNACSYGFYLVYVAKLLQIYRATTITAYIFLFGFLFVLPFGWSEFSVIQWDTLPDKAIYSIVFVVGATTIIAYFLNSWGVQKSSSTLVGSYIYLQPVLAALFAILLKQDVLSLEKTIFAALIILGVYLVSSGKK